MELLELIKELEKHDPKRIILNGFHNPHSYRGFYECLAFEPKTTAVVGEMLKCAKEALGATYVGYKGGEFKMGPYTDVYLANWGETGEELGPLLLSYMLKDIT